MSNNPLCTIGAHSVTHTFLSESQDVYSDIVGSKEYLEQLTGRSIEYFAYPYGKLRTVSHKCIKCAEQVGFKCAFSTIDAHITPLSAKCMYFLPRVVEF